MSHSFWFASDEVRERLANFRQRIRENPSPDDQPTTTTVGEFLGQLTGRALCRCLVCPCNSARTIDHPVVCRECAAGSHQPLFHGGVL